jgi:hypothetical protein
VLVHGVKVGIAKRADTIKLGPKCSSKRCPLSRLVSA